MVFFQLGVGVLHEKFGVVVGGGNVSGGLDGGG